MMRTRTSSFRYEWNKCRSKLLTKIRHTLEAAQKQVHLFVFFFFAVSSSLTTSDPTEAVSHESPDLV